MQRPKLLLALMALIIFSCKNTDTTVERQPYKWPEGIKPPVADKIKNQYSLPRMAIPARTTITG